MKYEPDNLHLQNSDKHLPSRRFSMAAGPNDGPKYGWRMALRAEIRFLASYNRNFSTRSKPS